MITSITSKNEAETIAFAKDIASKAQEGDFVSLQGPLGSGKSIFARSFIQSLSNKEIDVPSPTFTLAQSYDTSKGTIWHFDLYRIENPEEIHEIGWEEAISEGICLVEWSERLGKYMPETRTEIKFEVVSNESRKITLTKHRKN